jgi:hypothetical protein
MAERRRISREEADAAALAEVLHRLGGVSSKRAILEGLKLRQVSSSSLPAEGAAPAVPGVEANGESAGDIPDEKL